MLVTLVALLELSPDRSCQGMVSLNIALHGASRPQGKVVFAVAG
jgi:hypothetical protein